LNYFASVLKLAIHCKVSKQIVGGLPTSYPNQFPFSMAITIEENTKNKTGKLYNELCAINNVEVISDVEMDGFIDV